MPPWESVLSHDHSCCVCGKAFQAKRASAKYCSPQCQNRSRAPRHYDPHRTKQWREKRLQDGAYRKRLNLQANERAIAIRRWINEYKTSVGCIDCGYRESAVALDFDHIGDIKNRNVCFSKSIAQAKAEIALCEVRCANCHRERTHPLLALVPPPVVVPPVYSRVCPKCLTEFTTPFISQRHCGKRCGNAVRQKARRERLAGG